MFELFLGLTGGYLSWEILRYQRHRARLALIPLRIHVNGSRGKSSVTRLIAAGLSAGGHATYAKTTGTEPRAIHGDGSEERIFRAGKPNISEQLQIVRQACAQKATTLVIECMAITPDVLTVLEDKLIQSHIGVITNVRPDHLETMGPTLQDVGQNLARTIPRHGTVFTADSVWFPFFQEAAERRASRAYLVESEAVTELDMQPFCYLEHHENVALALAVCQHLGIERQRALAGMHQAAPDPGVLRHWVISKGDHRLDFYNAFAANDPESTLRIWQRVAPSSSVRKIALVILRPDRSARAQQYADFLSRDTPFDYCLVAGEPLDPVRRHIVRTSANSQKFFFLKGARPPEIFEKVQELSADAPVTLVMGMGNIVGLGEEVVSYFKRASEQYDPC
ncbi:poly-gamma-glutamate synthase PgsB [Candidatus Acetothermia bacterium]|nr:poly-gamma-glutamate synthase PgsB [Candidatus Acetothermia bacterium]